MELYIETLTGTAFELRVSPFETILSVKAKIQRLEGIPISQQHLIWQSLELEDDYCLHDYAIQDGATLKLVLAMRGGPINTRRVPMDDPGLREMAEYMESNRDELLDKLPGNRQVTLLVYREGDQLNFFRVVDRGDGTLTPLSESLSGASVYNLYDDEEDEGSPISDNMEENVRMKEKMRLLRSKMETMTVTKKPKKKIPHPPSGRPKSRSRHRHQLASSPRQRLTGSPRQRLNSPRQRLSSPRQHLASGTGMSKHHTAGPYSMIPKSYPPLPPVNQCNKTFPPPSSGLKLPNVKGAEVINARVHRDHQIETDIEAVKSADRNSKLSESSISPGANSPGTPLISAPGLEPRSGGGLSSRPKTSSRASQEELEAILKRQIQSPRVKHKSNRHVNSNKDSSVVMESPQRPVTSSRKREPLALQTVKESQPLLNPDASTSIKRFNSVPNERSSSRHGKNSPSFKEGRPVTSSRHKQGQGLLLESLTSQEARGLLRQTSLERLGSSKISSYVRSASKSRTGYYQGDRVYTPEGTRISARLRRSAGRDGCISPRLPPVKQKKKSKRCYICAKKTGLASSYQCRCGNNFCASHRYAETHGCTFDYKSEGRKLLQQSNPVVSAPKLPKI